MRRAVINQFDRYVKLNRDSARSSAPLSGIEEPGRLADHRRPPAALK